MQMCFRWSTEANFLGEIIHYESKPVAQNVSASRTVHQLNGTCAGAAGYDVVSCDQRGQGNGAWVLPQCRQPAVGVDEFFGDLYHLNAEEEPDSSEVAGLLLNGVFKFTGKPNHIASTNGRRSRVDRPYRLARHVERL